MAGVDTKLAAKEKRARKRHDKAVARRKRMNESCKASNETIVLASSTTTRIMTVIKQKQDLRAVKKMHIQKLQLAAKEVEILLSCRNLQLPWIEQRFQTAKPFLLTQKLSRAMVTALITTCTRNLFDCSDGHIEFFNQPS